MSQRIPVSILGATGVVGQRFVRRLAHHHLFEIRHLVASERSAGKRYEDACVWRLDGEPHGGMGRQKLVDARAEAAFAPVIFSALDSEVARELEPRYAEAGALVFSNAAAFRMEPDVPLLVPEVNPDHLHLLVVQRRRRSWKGGIICNPNCTATVLVMALAPLHAAFGVEAVSMTSMQAISGAGYPGVPSLDVLGNVIPFIRNEEAKVEEEIPKILGRYGDGGIVPDPMRVSAACHRVPVEDGHTEAVSVKLRGNPSQAEIREAMHCWRGASQRMKLASAPGIPIHVHDEEDRPQVRRDVGKDEGMSVHVGRLRLCPVLDFKFSLLGHNTERGAAGASVLNAELALVMGVLR